MPKQGVLAAVDLSPAKKRFLEKFKAHNVMLGLGFSHRVFPLSRSVDVWEFSSTSQAGEAKKGKTQDAARCADSRLSAQNSLK